MNLVTCRVCLVGLPSRLEGTPTTTTRQAVVFGGEPGDFTRDLGHAVGVARPAGAVTVHADGRQRPGQRSGGVADGQPDPAAADVDAQGAKDPDHLARDYQML